MDLTNTMRKSRDQFLLVLTVNNAFSDRVFFSLKKLLAKTFWKSSMVISLFVNFQSETLALEDFIRKTLFHHSEY